MNRDAPCSATKRHRDERNIPRDNSRWRRGFDDGYKKDQGICDFEKGYLAGCFGLCRWPCFARSTGLHPALLSNQLQARLSGWLDDGAGDNLDDEQKVSLYRGAFFSRQRFSRFGRSFAWHNQQAARAWLAGNWQSLSLAFARIFRIDLWRSLRWLGAKPCVVAADGFCGLLVQAHGCKGILQEVMTSSTACEKRK